MIGLTRVPSFQLAVTLAIALGCAGCEDVTTFFVDPEIRLSGQGGPGPDGDPEVVVGFDVGARFVPLDEDDGMRIINGLQGGTWTMPTVRTRGISQFASVVCTLETDVGERVGMVDAKVKFFPSNDGPLEVAGFPIPVGHAEDPSGSVDDLQD
ncbi:MAG: hypothetical protein ACI9MR_003507, partial [Myxococcota bacterium]